jgi:hypothetical protein
VDCDFPVYATNAGVLWMTQGTASDGIGGFLDFIGCRFGNFNTTMTQGFDRSVLGGGFVRMLGSSYVGCTDLADYVTGLYCDTLWTSGSAHDANILKQWAAT